MIFGEWLSWSVYVSAFLGALAWPKRRSLGAFLLATAGIGTILGFSFPTQPSLRLATLLIALVSGASVGMTWFHKPTVISRPFPTSGHATASPELNWARSLGGFIFLITGLSFCVEAGKGLTALYTLIAAIPFLALALFLLPGILLLRGVGIVVLVVIATLVGQLIGKP